jgi:hypothetical protein
MSGNEEKEIVRQPQRLEKNPVCLLWAFCFPGKPYSIKQSKDSILDIVISYEKDQ